MIYHNRAQTWNLDRAKAPGLDDVKTVHISNIDRLDIVQPRELSHGTKSKFEPDCGMKKFPTIVSFYTYDTLYQLEVQNLIASCEQFHLETEIEGVPSFGSWELNCAYKPFFILKKLEELKRPVLWVDADGVFVRKPEILEEFKADFATRINRDLSETHPSRVVSSTIYVNYTPNAVKILQSWTQECRRMLLDPQRTEEFWDQIALRNVLNTVKADVRSLPLAYIKIFDHPLDDEQEPNPVIMHYQASRRLKRPVNLNCGFVS